ncbi:MAG TPA: hypothetical protein VGI19_01915 [Candidatus Cybelea sp.]|jgi:hypothetical protein
MYRRWVPALIAVPAMALLMSLAAGVPAGRLGNIVTAGSVQLAPVYVAVLFGALLGRVTIETGIARAVVNLAAEFGGERPFVLSLAFCAIVAVLFTSLSGLGGIIMVGSIVLPIMMTAGVPRTIAATLFLMGFALGYIFNIANWTFYTKFFSVAREQLIHYAIVLAIIDALALLVYAIVSFRRERNYATWAVRAETSPDAPRVPAVALATPIVPLLLYYAFHMEAAVAFLVAAVFGVLVTRPQIAVQRLVSSAIRGVEDVAPAVLLFMGIGMLLVATQEPQFGAALRPLVAGGWLRNPLAYVLVFGAASPLALYRGPLNPFGVGIAIFTVLLTAHVLPPVILVAAIMAVVQVQNVCDPTNTANVWVANFTGVPIATITRRTLPYQVAVAVLGTLAVVIAAPALFGQPAFARIASIALADETLPGFYPPQSSASHIAVDDDGTALGRAAADAAADTLRAGGLGAFRLHDDPNARDCAGKPYTAYVRVESSTFTLVDGDDLDIGLRLADCGGWIVQEWHDHEIVAPQPGTADAAALARSGVDRLRAWQRSEPVRSQYLFARGVAVRPGDKPTYFYAFFRTADGNMRVYVRAGGPAYSSGLRSGEVLNKIDGKDWWLYGTYQTQQFAYDGKPHTFEVVAAGKTTDVTLGAPFALPASDAR